VHRFDARASEPRVAYRETIARSVEEETKHVKMSGGPGQYAHVKLRVEPGARGSGLVFVDRLRGGAIPTEYVPGVEKGIRQAATSGVIGGYPVVDVVATLLDGSYHSHDSSEMAFTICARRAFEEALRAAGPVLLEPVMRVAIDIPEPSIGAVVGDLGARRGRVIAIDREHVGALVPLASLFGYVPALRSLTQGRGTASMELDGYAPVPGALVARALSRA
jgi:elongation factor G